MQLILVRHGHAVPETVDRLRPLSETGREEARRTAALLRSKALSVALICHSQKERARETAGILKMMFCPGARLIEREGLAPDDRTDSVAEMLHQERENLCLVGHLPFVSCLLSRLVTGHEEPALVPFRTGTAAVLERDESGRWSVQSVIQP